MIQILSEQNSLIKYPQSIAFSSTARWLGLKQSPTSPVEAYSCNIIDLATQKLYVVIAVKSL